MDQELLSLLLGFLPPAYAHAVVSALVFASLVAVAVLPLKAAIARWVPQRWRAWTDGLFLVLDWLALNSRPLADRLTKEQRQAFAKRRPT